MAKVFLSHSSMQKPLIEDVANELGRDFVFLDKYDFESGKIIEEEIEDKINKSDIIVCFLSDEALASSWVQQELLLARDLVEENRIIFLPILIDNSVSHEDKRIPRWVHKYLLHYFNSPRLIARKIQQQIRMLSWEKNYVSIFKSRIMVGREKDLEEMSTKFFNTYPNEFRAIIVSGVQHSGRKRLMYELLMRKISTELLSSYIPITISLTEDNAIEYLIAQLNEYLHYEDDIYAIMSQGKESCKSLCIRMLNDFANVNEHIFINDSGSIITSDGTLIDWFKDIIQSKELLNQVHFYIAAQYSLSPKEERVNANLILAHRISSLNRDYLTALFNSYAKELGITSLTQEDVDFFVSRINGSPELAILILNDIKRSGLYRAKLEINNIVGMHDKNEYWPIWNKLQENADTRNILIVLSQFEFISYDILCQIYPNIELSNILEEISYYSLLDVFGPHMQFLRLNPLFADFISRAKFSTSQEAAKQLEAFTQNLLANLDSESLDLAENLYKIKEAIRRPDVQIDNKYLLPSFALSVVVDEYRDGNSDNVIEIAKKSLYGFHTEKYQTVERALRYWLCLAYCKKGDTASLDRELDYFYETNAMYTYYFIKGYSCRLKGKNYYERAIQFYRNALDYSNNVSADFLSKAEHELVITQMKMGNYEEALDLARKSYIQKPNNPYFEETYARCIIRSHSKNTADFYRIVEHMSTFSDNRKKVAAQVLKAEAIFYIEHNHWKAINELKKIAYGLPKDDKHIAYDALRQICEKQELLDIYRHEINSVNYNEADNEKIFEES